MVNHVRYAVLVIVLSLWLSGCMATFTRGGGSPSASGSWRQTFDRSNDDLPTPRLFEFRVDTLEP